MTTPVAGESVLLVPQVCSWLMNTHDSRNVLGHPSSSVRAAGGRRSVDATRGDDQFPVWNAYTPTLLRKGFGLLLVSRDGKLMEGPTDWDSGD